jgi:hypothetical protein
VAQAIQAGLEPALAYRADRGTWQFILPLAAIRADLAHTDLHVVTMDLPTFCFVVRKTAEASLA